MPKNMRNFEVSSGGFSGAAVVVVMSDSDAVEGVVEAGESWKDPDEADAMLSHTNRGMLRELWCFIFGSSCRMSRVLLRFCCRCTPYSVSMVSETTDWLGYLAVTFWIAIRAGVSDSPSRIL
jgi:hypothetical protein